MQSDQPWYMTRAVVIAANVVRELFAVEDESERCAVLWVLAGPTILVGDILKGSLTYHGRCRLIHPQGVCWASGDGNIRTRADALAVVDESMLKLVHHRPAANRWDPLSNQGGKRIQSRLLEFLT